jgi:hypothetical protein
MKTRHYHPAGNTTVRSNPDRAIRLKERWDDFAPEYSD